MDEKQFREWLKTKYPTDWESIWTIWGTNYQDSPYYQEAIGAPAQNQAPDWLQGLATIFGKSAEEEKWNQEFRERGFQWDVQKWQYEQQRQNASAAQQQQLAQRTMLENAKQRAYETARGQQNAFVMGDEQTQGLNTRNAAAKMFEEWRKRFESTLTQPTDWIKKWETHNMANPFAVKPFTPIEEARERDRLITKYKAQEKALKSNWDALYEQASNPSEDFGTQEAMAKANEITESRRQIQDSIATFEIQKKQIESSPEYKEAMQWATPQPMAVGGNMSVGKPEEPRKPKGAPTPTWLPEFVPELQGKSNISKFAVASPSLQQWGRTPWDVKQGLLGYADWAGTDPQRLVEQMNLSRTNTPNIAQRWSPSAQMA